MAVRGIHIASWRRSSHSPRRALPLAASRAARSAGIAQHERRGPRKHLRRRRRRLARCRQRSARLCPRAGDRACTGRRRRRVRRSTRYRRGGTPGRTGRARAHVGRRRNRLPPLLSAGARGALRHRGRRPRRPALALFCRHRRTPGFLSHPQSRSRVACGCGRRGPGGSAIGGAALGKLRSQAFEATLGRADAAVDERLRRIASAARRRSSSAHVRRYALAFPIVSTASR